MDHIPNEILSHILSYLLTDREKRRLRKDSICHVLPVRLSEDTIEDDFASWHQLLETDSIRNAIRRVNIETAPWDSALEEGNAILFWPDSWLENGYWPEFASAIDRIRDMPNLNSITLRFSLFCLTAERDDTVFQEPKGTRERTLELISEVLRNRESRPGRSTVRELVLSNLEDTPLPTDLTHSLLRNIDQLHMRFVYEVEDRESNVFSKYLQKTLLPSVAERLVELTLAGWLWGAIPVEFNPKGLSFPRLKRLKLDNFMIIRQDQFDWVLEQRSLVDLQLYNTRIATHCVLLAVDQDDFEYWGVNLHGWKELANNHEVNGPPLGSILNTPHSGELRPGWYMSDLRWSNMFDRIQQHLPLLRNFTFEHSDFEDFLEHYPGSPEVYCMGERYWTYGEGGWSTMWYKPAREHEWEATPFLEDDMSGTPVGLYERTEAADRRALEKLMEVTRKRREGK
ncbi:uncharacterized protein FFB20_07449 [Fusarium fujikuroi]|nr:hypothetical protein CEK25_010725 [Fusarium fujikuroi]SCN85469.1 uncharacterized protein FFB20_07449 [Fusarium fujikuroi]SCN96340.1 uncharacterized protein FFE2_08477 [Fusarium fujikuroi]SCO02278.1 uncharacterized protein FFM5_07803 [Fusarium fujikuroi]SCO21001.1 uncharacterized protein FFC1_13919 [Fusarium fujikuroi]